MPDTHASSPGAFPVFEAVAPAGMPAEIAGAIAEVMAGVKKLAKADTNAHERYSFASVDSFLESVGPLCAATGLIILMDEEAVELVERQGRNGSQNWLRLTFTFELGHKSGAMWPRKMRRTIMVLA